MYYISLLLAAVTAACAGNKIFNRDHVVYSLEEYDKARIVRRFIWFKVLQNGVTGKMEPKVMQKANINQGKFVGRWKDLFWAVDQSATPGN